jgi:RNA polymerase sigma factor (sigma-70 family)
MARRGGEGVNGGSQGEHAGRETGPIGDRVAARGLRVVSGEVYSDWEAIYQDNVERVYRLMFSKVGNRADAEDLTAEVFLAALRPLKVSASVGEVRAYLLATARTVLAAHWRSVLGREITSIGEDYEEQEPGPGAATPDPAAVSPAPGRVQALLRRMPERYRRILQLRFLEAYSVREAAAELGVSVSNAKVLQHRALRLAAGLGEEEQT